MSRNPFDEDNAPLPDFKDGERKGMKVLFAIWGDSGSGKTRSGCPVARGLAAHAGEDTAEAFSNPEILRRIDQRVFVIDTDAGRAQHYMPAPGEEPRADRFAFKHAELGKPYTTKRMLDMARKAKAGGAEVILIDSFSMLWDGEGGCSDWHEAIVEEVVARKRRQYDARDSNRYPFDEDYEREKASMTAWKAPKVDWRRMERELLDLGVHLVVCGHADDKLSIEKEKDARGEETKKTVVIQPKDKPINERWVPIAEKKFKRRLSVSVVLTPDDPGVPHMLKKVDAEIAECIPLDKQLNANVGLRLGRWARGQKKPNAGATNLREEMQREASPPPPPMQQGAGQSDFFPGDAPLRAGDGGVIWKDAAFAPDRPVLLQPRPDGGGVEAWRPWANALRKLIEAAPDLEAKRRWRDLNIDFALRAAPPLAAWIDETMIAASDEDDAPPARSVAGEF